MTTSAQESARELAARTAEDWYGDSWMHLSVDAREQAVERAARLIDIVATGARSAAITTERLRIAYEIEAELVCGCITEAGEQRLRDSDQGWLLARRLGVHSMCWWAWCCAEIARTGQDCCTHTMRVPGEQR